MKPDYAISIGGNALTYVLSAVQTNEWMQIVSFVLSSVVSVLLIAFRLWAWWKEASKDGKIDKTEIEDAINILEDHKKEGE